MKHNFFVFAFTAKEKNDTKYNLFYSRLQRKKTYLHLQ